MYRNQDENQSPTLQLFEGKCDAIFIGIGVLLLIFFLLGGWLLN